MTLGGGRSAGLALGFHLSGLQPGSLAPRFMGSAQFKKELETTEHLNVTLIIQPGQTNNELSKKDLACGISDG